MKRCVILILFILFISNDAKSQLFWKISKPNSLQTSYLFGTHHLIPKEAIPKFDLILDLCCQSEVLIGEVVMNNSRENVDLMNYSTMNVNTIQNLVSKQDFKMLDREYMKLLGFGIDYFNNFKPMALISMQQIHWYLIENGLSKQPESIDAILQSAVVANGKQIVGLETLEEQLSLLMNTLSVERQATILVESVKNKSNELLNSKRLQNAYLQGDLSYIYKMWLSDTSLTEKEKNEFSDIRNLKWMPKINDLVSEKQCFIAVGYVHLLGDNGLINQLKKAGYLLEPVNLFN